MFSRSIVYKSGMNTITVRNIWSDTCSGTGPHGKQASSQAKYASKFETVPIVWLGVIRRNSVVKVCPIYL